MDTETLVRCFNSVPKARIIAVMVYKGDMTSKEIIESLPDISQATLYRSIGQMEEDGILEVVREEKKRAIIEKTYSFEKVRRELARIVEDENDKDAFYAIMASYLLVMLDKFKRYCSSEDANILRDGAGIAGIALYATPQELDDIALRISQVCEPYSKRTSSEQQAYIASIVVTPPEKETRDDLEDGA